MEQLVDIVYYLYQEIHDNFGPDGKIDALWFLKHIHLPSVLRIQKEVSASYYENLFS